MEETKNICFTKCESTVHHRTLNRWFKKFCLGCKNIDDQTTMESAIYKKITHMLTIRKTYEIMVILQLLYEIEFEDLT